MNALKTRQGPCMSIRAENAKWRMRAAPGSCMFMQDDDVLHVVVATGYPVLTYLISALRHPCVHVYV